MDQCTAYHDSNGQAIQQTWSSQSLVYRSVHFHLFIYRTTFCAKGVQLKCVCVLIQTHKLYYDQSGEVIHTFSRKKYPFYFFMSYPQFKLIFSSHLLQKLLTQSVYSPTCRKCIYTIVMAVYSIEKVNSQRATGNNCL